MILRSPEEGSHNLASSSRGNPKVFFLVHPHIFRSHHDFLACRNITCSLAELRDG